MRHIMRRADNDDDTLIEGIFTAEFCEKLWNKMHPGIPYNKHKLDFAIARMEAWEMMGF